MARATYGGNAIPLAGSHNMTTRRFIFWHRIDCEFGPGSWAVDDDIITVTCAHGSKSAQLGSVPGPISARLLIFELNEQRDVA